MLASAVEQLFLAILKTSNLCTIVSSPLHDIRFTMSSLYGLEQIAGIKIVTTLARVHNEVMSAAGVTLNKVQRKKFYESTNTGCLEIVINQWESENSGIPPTWGSLLTILQDLGLQDLQQQVEDVVGKLCSYA